jgi:SAM-dependent methyltransferase
MSFERLEEHRRLWEAKPVLRAIYEDYYRRIVAACRPGLTLEIGGGSGNLKSYLGGVVSTDIVNTPWLDAAADAQCLPFREGCFDNLVCVDVLHHVERPRRFLAEAARVLRPLGRIILLEPAITPLSWSFYRWLHPEPVDMSADPLEDGPLDPGRAPFDANQGVPTLLFGRHRAQLARAFPELEVLRVDHLSLLAYPLSGGFRPWSAVPVALVAPLLRLEERVAPLLGRLMGFRLLAVLQKADISRASGCADGSGSALGTGGSRDQGTPSGETLYTS